MMRRLLAFSILAAVAMAVPAAAQTVISIDVPSANSTAQQPFPIAGWAIDPAATGDTGIDAIHVYAYPNPGSGAPPIFIGYTTSATYGFDRSDVAAIYGPQFRFSGFGLPVSGLAPGTYLLAVYAHRVATGEWGYAAVVVNVLANPVMSLNPPVNNSPVLQPFLIAGWAIDLAATTGSGVSAIHVWAWPVAGGPVLWVGAAIPDDGSYGVWRSDIASLFGAQFGSSGFNLLGSGLPTGDYTLVAYAYSTVSATFAINQIAQISVDAIAPAPGASPAPGTIEIGQGVTLTGVPGSTIRYTVDGSEPTGGSAPYTGQIILNAPTTIKAKTFVAGYFPSTTASFSYTIRNPTPAISHPTGLYNPLPAVSISIPPGTVVRYTVNGTDPTPSSPTYSGGNITVAHDTTVRATAYRDGWEPSSVAAATYLLDAPVDNGSPMQVSLQFHNETKLNHQTAGVPLTLLLSGAELANPFAADVSINGQSVDYSGSSHQIVVVPQLSDGPNVIDLTAADTNGLRVSESFTVWAGSRGVEFRVANWLDSGISGATIRVYPERNPDVSATAVTAGNGFIGMNFLPAGPGLIAEFSAPGHRTLLKRLAANASSVVALLDADNNNFSYGLTGWTVNSNWAFPFAHSEASRPWTPCEECIRPPGSPSGMPFGRTDSAEASPPPQAPPPDEYDLILDADVGVFAEVRATRVFRAASGSRAVSIRYRFSSSEALCGPGTPCVRQEDYFRIKANSTVVAQGSVSQFAGQYDVNGSLGWKVLTVDVPEDSSVTLEFAVANVGDALFATTLEVDQISEVVYSARIRLTEQYQHRVGSGWVVRTEPLRYLSVLPHNYGPAGREGFTPISGSIVLDGPASDSLTALTLRIIPFNGLNQPLASVTGQLTTQAAAALLNRPLHAGSNGLTYTGLLFDVDTRSLGFLVTGFVDQMVLEVRATTQSGKQFTWIPGPDFLWAFWHSIDTDPSRRFGGRDVSLCIATSHPCNGDDWTYLPVFPFLDTINSFGIRYNDLSNMNGGYFPIHHGHENGLEIDALFEGYVPRDKDTLTRLIALINYYGRSISRIWVTFRNIKPDFQNALASAPLLLDGRRVSDVIQHSAGHADHFHINLATKSPFPR